jgi:indolepyruvate ferredoxin oxidoreductase beta subunit
VTDCLIVGVGGQGTVLTSRLIGIAALKRGFDVRGSETIGMAQRGGSVASHVRIGRDISSPLIPRLGADVILAFELCEAARAVPYLKPDGLMIACDVIVRPAGSSEMFGIDAVSRYLRSSLAHIRLLDGEKIRERCGARGMNVAILGAALSSGSLPLSMEDIEEALDDRFDVARAEANKAALRFGARMIADAGLKSED